MRILYLGSFLKPYDTEVYVYKSLESLGHQVIKMTLEQATIERLASVIETVDLILFSKGTIKKNQEEVWDFIKSFKVPTVGWFWDLAWGTSRESLIQNQPLFKCDFVFSTDGGHDEEFKKSGINHHLLRQGIFEPEAYMAERTNSVEDIIFVGSSAHSYSFGWGYRDKLIAWLQNTYKHQFGWYGKDVPVRNDDLNQLFANTKIVIGDSVASPNYWSNRLYETLGRGGFLIFPSIDGIEKDFTPYKDFIPYHLGDFEGLKSKIDYFLSHDEEREKIRKSGFEHCKQFHTYSKRCEELLCIVNSTKKK